MCWGSSPGEQLEFQHTRGTGLASPLCLQVWSGNKREWLQGSIEDTGTVGQRHHATLQALPVGTKGALPPGSPILAVPSPDTRQQQSLPSPSLPPSFPLQFLLLFLASRPLRIVKW